MEIDETALAAAQGTTEAVMARRLIEAVCEARDRG